MHDGTAGQPNAGQSHPLAVVFSFFVRRCQGDVGMFGKKPSRLDECRSSINKTPSPIGFFCQWFYGSYELLSRYSKADVWENAHSDMPELWKDHLDDLESYLDEFKQKGTKEHVETLHEWFNQRGACTVACTVCVLWIVGISRKLTEWEPVSVLGECDAIDRQEKLIIQCANIATSLSVIDTICNLQDAWNRTPPPPTNQDAVSDYIYKCIAFHRELLWDIVDIYVFHGVIEIDRAELDDGVRSAHAKALASVIRESVSPQVGSMQSLKQTENLRIQLFKFVCELARHSPMGHREEGKRLITFLIAHNYRDRADRTIDYFRLWLEYRSFAFTGNSAETSDNALLEIDKWKVVAAKLEELRAQGEKPKPYRGYADEFGCSKTTIAKAISSTPSLAAWAAKKRSKPRAVDFTQKVADETHQIREIDPSEAAAIREFIENETDPRTKAWFIAQKPEDQIAFLDDPDKFFKAHKRLA